MTKQSVSVQLGVILLVVHLIEVVWQGDVELDQWRLFGEKYLGRVDHVVAGVHESEIVGSGEENAIVFSQFICFEDWVT